MLAVFTKKKMLAAAIVAVAGGASIAAVQAGSTPSEEPALRAYDRPLATAVQQDQTDGFAVFNRARTASDAMPKDAREIVGDSHKTGRNLALSRAIKTPTGTGWAVPGQGTMCAVMPDPVDGYGISCVDTSFALNKGLFVGLVMPDNPKVFNMTWVIPRGATASVTFNHGRTQALEPDSDGVIGDSLRNARSVNLRTAAGKSSELPLPSLPAPVRPTHKDCGGKAIPVDAVCAQ